jgi:hypothetical protein
MKLHCFALNSDPPKITPARASRQWMDDFPDRHAYRCLPLTIATRMVGTFFAPSLSRSTGTAARGPKI